MDEIDNKAHKADTSSDDLAPAENAVVAAEADAEADATSDDLTQAENDAVAAEADAKADSKPKAKAKSTRSKAKKADATSEDLAQDENAAVAAETDTKANAKPKAKSTRSKAKKADTSSEDLAQSENAVVAAETAAKADAKPKAKAKSTRSKAKKADTSSEDLAQSENAVVASETAAKDDAKPKAKSTRSKAKKADDGHEHVLVDATSFGEDVDFFSSGTTGEVPLYQNKRDVLQAMKNFFKAHRAAFDNAQDPNEKSMISRRLQIINDFLNKGILLARGLRASKVKFELFADRIETIFLNSLYQGMKYQDVRALAEIMNLFLQYIELSHHDRNFNNGLYYLAKAKVEYIVSVIEP